MILGVTYSPKIGLIYQQVQTMRSSDGFSAEPHTVSLRHGCMATTLEGSPIVGLPSSIHQVEQF
ncbi:hypothetical protein D8Y22_15240 [Salinadaptatus halalkaliphilus]|uniref:Uncharacterized protein n=1 Tax=Salinadaptatus halalkaliphilus TaxID=2419781 RepID=A0A4S3TJ32_9EURY|nr:hypothetical protein D8Y22_15240 [Salinadaptatus halalkaliphilus]